MQRPGAGRRRKVALITGASSGIGEEFAKQLAARDCSLVIVARSGEKLEQLAIALKVQHQVEVEVIAADLTKPEDRARVEARLAAEPAIDLLVNNAGVGTFGPFAEADADAEEAEIQLNIIALSRLTNAALPGMVARKNGAIINVSSVAGFFPGPNNATYSASKAFVNAFSETISEELRGSGVRIQALCPGFTRTEFQKNAGIEASSIPEMAWLDVKDVVSESLAALNHGTLFCVPGVAYKSLTFASGLIPRPLIRRIAGLYGRQVH